MLFFWFFYFLFAPWNAEQNVSVFACDDKKGKHFGLFSVFSVDYMRTAMKFSKFSAVYVFYPYFSVKYYSCCCYCRSVCVCSIPAHATISTTIAREFNSLCEWFRDAYKHSRLWLVPFKLYILVANSTFLLPHQTEAL